MIRVDRSSVSEPSSLAAEKYGELKNQTEGSAVLAAIAHFIASGNALDEFRYAEEFEAYKKNDVKRALAHLFRGKCAYCESRYANTQPMDVEHWRPKAVVDEEDSSGRPVRRLGYPWLASDWENLLPSCIDCNRARMQTDAVTGVVERQGKANQFPITGQRWRPPVEGVPASREDVPLLLNPTIDNPAEHLSFGTDGTVLPRSDSPKGKESIRVYALNRSELALERLGLARLIEQRLVTIEALASLREAPGLSTDLRLNIDDLIAHEINALYEMTDPERPYSEMARQVIEANAPK